MHKTESRYTRAPDELARIVEPAAELRHNGGIEQNHGDFREFARLQLNADFDPALRAFALDANDGQMRRQNEHHVHDKQKRRVIRKTPIIEGITDKHGDNTHCHAHELTRERIVLVRLNRRPYHEQAIAKSATTTSTKGTGTASMARFGRPDPPNGDALTYCPFGVRTRSISLKPAI